MNDELHHYEPSCEEAYPADFDQAAYGEWLGYSSMSEDDVDAFYESRTDLGD